MGDSNKSSKGKTIGIIVIIVVLLCSSVVGVIYGILNLVENFIKGIVGAVANAGKAVFDWFKHIFGMSRIVDGMYIYPLEKDSVNQLKQQIEAQGIRTDEAGITEVMLRKMILAQAVTSLTKDSLCVAEVEKDEILQDTGYTELDEYFKTLDKKKGKDEWPIDKHNYDLYYITDKFFYFKDEDDMVQKGEGKYYLGLIGSIDIISSEGVTLEYVSNEEFETAKNNFIELSEKEKNKEDQRERIDLLHKYTIENEEIVVHKIVKNTETYKYTLTNNNSNTKIDEVGDANSTYEIVTVPLDIQGSIDTSKYTISIELLINLLNISASPEFVDEFIDYALENSKINITAYSVSDEEVSYEKNRYNIKDKFIYELYDIVDVADIGSDNMETYRELIHNRVYGGNRFDCSVVDLPNFESINYGQVTEDASTEGYDDGSTQEDTEEDVDTEEDASTQGYDDTSSEEDTDGDVEVEEEDTTPSVGKISDYLLTAYDPKGFSLGEVSVDEVTIIERAETSWKFFVSSMSTWYGDITYDKPIENIDCFINSQECTVEEYDSFNEKSLSQHTDISGEENKTKKYIYQGRAEEVGITETQPYVSVVNSADIYDNIINAKSGNKETDFENWTIKGLGEISTKDGGTYNSTTGVGSGSDYLYTKFTKTNRKNYNKITKYKRDNIEQNTNLPQVNMDKVYNFLALWKNETGQLGNNVYKSDGEKVKYKDIYNTTTAVADLFVSAPEMLFDLLEQYDSTRELVDIFKYIMYLYTGTDYGISNESQIAFILSTSTYGGSDYIVNTVMSDEELVLTKQQLEDAIKKTYSGDVEKNLLSCIDDFMYIQQNNKVNAVFAVAVTIIESSGGTDWDAIDPSTYNWMSVTGSYNGNSYKNPNSSNTRTWRLYPSFNEATRDFGDLIANGSYYFRAGKYSVSTIAPTYCNEKWGANVIAETTKLYDSIGVKLVNYGEGGIGGYEEKGFDQSKVGYSSVLHVGTRTYKNFKQAGVSPWSGHSFRHYTADSGSTIGSYGCSLTSIAVIASGFGHNVTPVTIRDRVQNEFSNYGQDQYAARLLAEYTGMNATYIKGCDKNAIINQLKEGNPVMVLKNGYHWWVILSISEDGKKAYVSDVGWSRRTGWEDIDSALTYYHGGKCDRYIKLSK